MTVSSPLGSTTSDAGAAERTPARRPAGTGARWAGAMARSAVGLVSLVAAYELLRLVGVLPSASAPGVPSIGSALVSGLADGTLTGPLGDTAQAWALGLAVATAIGLPLGMVTGLSRWADSVTGVAVEFLRPVPAVALIPVGIVVFGLEIGLQVFLVAFATVWPVLIGSRHGVRTVDPLLIDSARALGQSRARVLYRVVVPASVPAFATGLRTAAGIGVVVAVAVEIVSGSPGLGYHLNSAQQSGRVTDAFAAVLLAGLFGVVVDLAARAAENRLAGWQRHTTEGRR
ncbi:ABC transporter permease [Streptomyces sp. NPDC006356]